MKPTLCCQATWWLRGKESACQCGRHRRLGFHPDPLEDILATHSSILAWRISWTEDPGRVQSMGSQRAGRDWVSTCARANTQPEGRVREGVLLPQLRRGVGCEDPAAEGENSSRSFPPPGGRRVAAMRAIWRQGLILVKVRRCSNPNSKAPSRVPHKIVWGDQPQKEPPPTPHPPGPELSSLNL